MKARRAQPEADEQKAFVLWFRIQYPKYAGALMAHIGVKLTGKEYQRANKMREQKLMGYKKGISDIQISVPNDEYHGLWIEFKAPKKTVKALSDDQVKHIYLMSALGYKATWCDTAEKAMAITKEYMRGVNIL